MLINCFSKNTRLLGLNNTRLFRSKWLNFFHRCTERKIESFWPKMLSHLSWVETKTFRLNWKKKLNSRDSLFRSKWLNFSLSAPREKNWVILTLKLSHWWNQNFTQLFRSKWVNYSSQCTERKNWVILI